MQQSHHIPIFVHCFRAKRVRFYLLFLIFFEWVIISCLSCKLLIHSKVFMVQIQTIVAVLKISWVVESILMSEIQSALIGHNWNNQIIRKGEFKIIEKIYIWADFCTLTTCLSSFMKLLPLGQAIFPLRGTWSKELSLHRSDFSPQPIESFPLLVLLPARKPLSVTMSDGALIYSRGTEQQFWSASPSAPMKEFTPSLAMTLSEWFGHCPYSILSMTSPS